MTVDKKFPSLKSTRIALREIVESDIENIFKGLSNPDVIKQYGISFDSYTNTQATNKRNAANIDNFGIGNFDSCFFLWKRMEQILTSW